MANKERVQEQEAARVEERDRRKEANCQQVYQRAVEVEAAAAAAVAAEEAAEEEAAAEEAAAEEAAAHQQRNQRRPHKPRRKVRFHLPMAH